MRRQCNVPVGAVFCPKRRPPSPGNSRNLPATSAKAGSARSQAKRTFGPLSASHAEPVHEQQPALGVQSAPLPSSFFGWIGACCSRWWVSEDTHRWLLQPSCVCYPYRHEQVCSVAARHLAIRVRKLRSQPCGRSLVRVAQFADSMMGVPDTATEGGASPGFGPWKCACTKATALLFFTGGSLLPQCISSPSWPVCNHEVHVANRHKGSGCSQSIPGQPHGLRQSLSGKSAPSRFRTCALALALNE